MYRKSFDRMLAIYKHMRDHSELVNPIEFYKFDIPLGATDVRMYRGFTHSIASAIGMEIHHVGQNIPKLVVLESIRRVKRGTQGKPSVFLIEKPPNKEEFEKLQERSLVTGRYELRTVAQRAQDSVNALSKTVSELEKRVTRLEQHDVQKDASLRNPST